jgi:hypothetical protein
MNDLRINFKTLTRRLLIILLHFSSRELLTSYFLLLTSYFLLLTSYFLLLTFCRLAPDDVFVVTTVDQRVDFAVGSVAEQDSAFDAFAEEKL